MDDSVLNNLIGLQTFILRWHIEQKNHLFSLCIDGGMLIIADSTKNNYVHNRTVGLEQINSEWPELRKINSERSEVFIFRNSHHESGKAGKCGY